MRRFRLPQHPEPDPQLAAPINRFVTWVPPGHFYSIVPGEEDVDRAKRRLADAGPTLPGIDVDAERLRDEFRRRAALVQDWEQDQGRYRAGNGLFDIGDAAMLRASLLLLRPSRVIEVGSGWSSACILDARDDGRHHFEVTFIDPYPAALLDRLSPEDRATVNIVESEVQAVPTEVFGALGDGDVLFIDSSHAFKPGSDVDDYFARILPAVAVGVHVHVHDIFWPFEVPAQWLDEGRGWNEAHALRNFLYANSDWEIVLFNDYLGRFHRDLIAANLPAALENVGASIWLRRVR